VSVRADARRALALLLALRARGAVRGLFRRGRRASQLFAVALVGLWILGMQAGREPEVARGVLGLTAVETSSLYLTPFLVLGVLGGAWSRGLGFATAEVQLLFAAPLSDGMLVLWRMASNLSRMLPTALVLALLVPAGTSYAQRASTWLLVMAIIATVSVALGARIATLGRRRRRWARAGLVAAVVAALALAAWLGARDGGATGALRALSTPGQPFARCLLAPTGEAAARAALPLVMILVGAALWGATVHGGVREPAVEVSRTLDRALDRVRQAGPWGGSPARSRTLPRLPHWGGAGPHVWRQLTTLARRRRPFLALILVSGFVVLPQLVIGDEPRWAAAVLAMLAMLVFVGPIYVQCDFRSDFDQLAWMRSWPCSPYALAAGQLLASALVLTALQVLLTLWYPILIGYGEHTPLALGILAVLPLTNLMNVAVWNAGFLLFPARPPVSGAQAPSVGDIGRWQLLLVGSMLATLTLLGVAGGFAALASWVAGELLDLPRRLALLAGLAAGLLAMALQTASAIWLVGRLFRRIDPARDLLE